MATFPRFCVAVYTRLAVRYELYRQSNGRQQDQTHKRERR